MIGGARWVDLRAANYLLAIETVKVVSRTSSQFLKVDKQLADNSKFWNNSYDDGLWYSLVDLVKASCSFELLVVDSKLFDFTGAEIRLSTSPDGVKYLHTVRGLNKKIISLTLEHNRYEFKNKYLQK